MWSWKDVVESESASLFFFTRLVFEKGYHRRYNLPCQSVERGRR